MRGHGMKIAAVVIGLLLAFMLVVEVKAAPVPHGVTGTVSGVSYTVNLDLDNQPGFWAGDPTTTFVTVVVSADCSVRFLAVDSTRYKSGAESMDASDDATVGDLVPLFAGKNTFSGQFRAIQFVDSDLVDFGIQVEYR